MTPQPRFGLILLFFLISSGFVIAQEVAIETRVGFVDRFRSGYWTPITVVVDSGPTPLDAILQVEYQAGTALSQGRSLTIIRQLRQDPGASGRYSFSLPLRISTYPLMVRLEADGEIIAEQSLSLRPLGTESPLIVGLSRRPSLDAALPFFKERSERWPEIVYPHVESLPVDALAWDGIETVLWHDLPPDRLSSSSATALANWVARGGELVVFGGPWLIGREFPETLPAVSVTEPIRDEENSIILYPPSIPDSQNRASEFPESLVHEYSWGDGVVRYVEVNLASPELPRSTREALWTLLAQKGSRIFPTDSRDSTDALLYSLDEISGPEIPSRLYPFLFLFGYCIVSAVIFVLGRKQDRILGQSLHLVALFLVAGIAALAGWLFFDDLGLRSEVSYREVSILVDRDDGGSEVFGSIAIGQSSSASRRIEITSSDVVLQDLSTEDFLVIEEAEGLSVPSWDLEPWKRRVLRYAGTGPTIWSLSGSLWTNQGDSTLRNLVFLPGDGNHYLLEELLRPGESLDLDAIPGTNGSLPEEYVVLLNTLDDLSVFGPSVIALVDRSFLSPDLPGSWVDQQRHQLVIRSLEGLGGTP